MCAAARLKFVLPRFPSTFPGKFGSMRWTDPGLAFRRALQLRPSEIAHPPISDFVLVAYRKGATRITRRANGPSRSCQVTPGHISLLTSSVASEWAWEEPIDVLHVYLETGLMSEVMGGVFDWQLAGAQLRDLLDVHDEFIVGLGDILVGEAENNEPGLRLFVESLAHQLCIHLLRRYFDLKPSAMATIGEFEQAVVNRVRDHIMENLGEDPFSPPCRASLGSVRPISGACFVAPSAFLAPVRLERQTEQSASAAIGPPPCHRRSRRSDRLRRPKPSDPAFPQSVQGDAGPVASRLTPLAIAAPRENAYLPKIRRARSIRPRLFSTISPHAP